MASLNAFRFGLVKSETEVPAPNNEDMRAFCLSRRRSKIFLVEEFPSSSLGSDGSFPFFFPDSFPFFSDSFRPFFRAGRDGDPALPASLSDAEPVGEVGRFRFVGEETRFAFSDPPALLLPLFETLGDRDTFLSLGT